MTIPPHSSRYIIRLVALAALLAACACSSHRRSGLTGAPSPAESPAELASELVANARPWRNVTVPVSLSVKDSGLPRLSGTLSMCADESIHLSIRFLGMEMGALYVDADSLKGYIKPRKMYIAESIPDLMGGFPATVGNLQSLLMGELFTLGAPVPSLKGADISVTGADAYIISPPAPAAGLEYCFGVRLPANTIAAVVFTASGRAATVLYPEPGQLDIKASVGGKSVEASLGLDLGRARIDQPSFSRKSLGIPGGYKRVRLSSLLKALQTI